MLRPDFQLMLAQPIFLCTLVLYAVSLIQSSRHTQQLLQSHTQHHSCKAGTSNETIHIKRMRLKYRHGSLLDEGATLARSLWSGKLSVRRNTTKLIHGPGIPTHTSSALCHPSCETLRKLSSPKDQAEAAQTDRDTPNGVTLESLRRERTTHPCSVWAVSNETGDGTLQG